MLLNDEKELEDYLFEKDPLEFNCECFRQVPIGGYGILDLLYVDMSANPGGVTITVWPIELKKNEIDFNAIGQISRYKTGIERYLINLQRKYKKQLDICVEPTLIGKCFADGDVCLLYNHLDWLQVYFYDVSIENGISFTNISHAWNRTKENLNTLDSYKDELLPLFKKELRESIRLA